MRDHSCRASIEIAAVGKFLATMIGAGRCVACVVQYVHGEGCGGVEKFEPETCHVYTAPLWRSVLVTLTNERSGYMHRGCGQLRLSVCWWVASGCEMED